MKLEEEIKMNSFDDIFQKAYLNLMVTSNWLETNAVEQIKPFGISLPQFNILRILRGQKGNPISATDIKDRMIHKNSNVTRILEKLLDKDYVKIQGCKENRRKMDVTITQAGLDLLSNMECTIKSSVHRLEHFINESEAAQLSSLLDKVRQ